MSEREPRAAGSSPTRRADYRPPGYKIEEVDLAFELGLPVTRVTATLSLIRDAKANESSLILDGRNLKLTALRLDGSPVPVSEYEVKADGLYIRSLPPRCRLTVVTEISPADNPGLEGLNFAAGTFFTHCEPEGFRRITYFLDRPDILARYRCTIVANKAEFPVLLSNGNCLQTGELGAGRHFARWEDPFPKASYLFALVAGNFEMLSDRFVTRSGRGVTLTVYASPEDIGHCRFGLDVLKEAMAWDERAYGREYDLDQMNIAVMRSYPGGAMENKGLNLYTSELFAVSPSVASDDNMRWTHGVVAHEYLHNWTGNRVGCRNWFELSLKEGFTIFRQREFVASQIGDSVSRIDEVVRLREYQFPEDDGGNAHAVRPQSYLTVSNLYTPTVYEKGAELIRAMKVLVGPEAFSRGAQRFFERFDGKAAAIDDLIDSVADSSQQDLAEFRRWYDVVGPVFVDVHRRYDPKERRLSLVVRQRCGTACPGEAFPVRMPIVMGLLSASGDPIAIRGGDAGAAAGQREIVLSLAAEEEEFTFEDVPPGAIPSLFRGYSAPVRVATDLADAELAVLAAKDADPFNRWDAMQQLAIRAAAPVTGSPAESASFLWLEALTAAVAGARQDPGFAARLLRLPAEAVIGETQNPLDVDGIRRARRALAEQATARLRTRLRYLRDSLERDAAMPGGVESRRLSHLCQWYLMQAPEPEDLGYTWRKFECARTLEARGSALRLLVSRGGDDRTRALEQAYASWKGSPALLDQWFAIQASSEADDTADLMAALVKHPEFDLRNGTRVKITFDAFTTNQGALHDGSGVGYGIVQWLTLALNKPHPRLAARFLKRLDGWARLDERRRNMLADLFRRVLVAPELSQEIFEVASRSLKPRRSETSYA